jgi:NADP-dependent 3-hydroxy acid dehydrogenase YdfG
MKTIYNILDLTDDDLKQLMEKYKEKKMRYDLMYNEATIRNEKNILNIHLEQVRRFRETHLKAFRDAKMDIS